MVIPRRRISLFASPAAIVTIHWRRCCARAAACGLSFYAVFGWFNLRPPQWVYWFWNGVALLAAAGALWALWTGWRGQADKPERAETQQVWGLGQRIGAILRRPWVLPALLALWVAGVYASLVLFMMQTEAAQGRLLFPALLPVALGAAFGVTSPRLLRRLAVFIPPAALVITLYCLFFVIRPAYEPPGLVTELPLEATQLDEGMGQGVRLLGSFLETEEALPGEPVRLTLYWQAEDVPADTPEHVLSIFGRDGVEIGKVHSYHGRGLYPADQWPERRIVADRFGVWIAEDARTPVLAHIDSTLRRGDNSVQVGQVKLVPAEWPTPVGPPLGMLGTAVGFADVQIAPERARAGNTVTLSLQWQALDDPETDFTALVHLGQPDEPPLATGDRPPLNGDYPTSAWAAGEVIDDAFTLVIPPGTAPGRYPVWLGMYDSRTFARLPVTLDGEAQPFDVYLAGWVEIEE